MKIMFLTGYPISHIIPIKGLIRDLNRYNCNVLCIVNKENMEYCENNNIECISYPDNLWRKKHREAQEEKDKKIRLYENEHQFNFSEFYNVFLEKDAIEIFNYYEDVANWIESAIDKYQPDIVFRDSIEIYWRKLKEKIKYKEIRTIGYITNNLYSWDYLMSSTEEILPIFLGIGILLPIVSKEYMNNFKSNLTRIYKKVSKELNEEYIPPYYQYDPNESINIIFSQKTLQPVLNGRKNLLIYPPLREHFEIEKNIDEDIRKFCEQSNIIYISTGSFISREVDYYSEIIAVLNNCEAKELYKIVISGGKATDEIIRMLETIDVNFEIMIKKRVPQLFVLSHSKLFITAGGMNSIKESIYFKVPMVVFPITSEQRLNGMIIEKLGVGHTTYKSGMPIIHFKNNISTILESNYKKSFDKFKLDYDIDLDFFERIFGEG